MIDQANSLSVSWRCCRQTDEMVDELLDCQQTFFDIFADYQDEEDQDTD